MESRNCTRLDLVCCSETRGLDGLWLVTVTTAGDTLPFDLNHTRLFSPFNSDVFFLVEIYPTDQRHVYTYHCLLSVLRKWYVVGRWPSDLGFKGQDRANWTSVGRLYVVGFWSQMVTHEIITIHTNMLGLNFETIDLLLEDTSSM